MGNPRTSASGTLVVIAMVLVILTLAAGTGRAESESPDLSVISLNVIPRINHYEISVVIRNLGGSSTEPADGSIFDEHDLRTGEEELITNFQIPSLDPGEDYTGKFSWTRETTGYHRLWVTADVEGRINEIDKENNVAFKLIQLPAVNEISASFDGMPDHDASGRYISGISTPVNFSIGFSGLSMPDLLRVYASIDGGPSRYAPTGSGGISHITYDMGDLHPGVHSLEVNATSSGFPMEKERLLLSVGGIPQWFSNLSHRKSDFNSSLSAYVLTGYVDIPTMTFIPDLQGVDDMDPLEIFADQRDLYMTAYILLDGTTTIEIDGDARIETPSSSATYRLSGRGYFPSPHDDLEITVGGSGEVEIDLGSMMRPGKIDYEILDNLSIPLVFSPILKGSSGADLELGLSASGEVSVTGGLGIDAGGNDESTIGCGLYGPDNPIIYSNMEVEWSTTHHIAGAGSSWAGQGSVTSVINAGMVDVGISGYDPVEEENVSDMGFDLSEGLDGSIGSAYIPVEAGSISSVYHVSGDDIELVHQSNLYKSNPGLSYLSENRTLVVWAEAGSYSTDMMERASSMRLFASLGNSTGGFGESEPLFHSASTDSRPVIVRDDTGSVAALFWQRDLDGDIRTRDDNRIMFSKYQADSWSEPEVISRNEGANLLPTAFYSTNGDIWAAWSIDGRIAYRVYIFDDGRWSDIKYLKHLDAEGVLYNPRMAGGHGDLPDLVYVRSGMGWENDFVVVSRTGDRARESLLSDERIITQSDYWMENPSGYKDKDDVLHVVWRERNGGDGEIFASRSIADATSTRWLPKLRITDDSAIQLAPSLVPAGKGVYMMGWYSLAAPSQSVNQSEIGKFDLGEKNLSMAAEVVSLTLSSDDYEIGDTVFLNAEVRNMGMSRDSEITIVLRRLMRDPASGEKIVYDLSWKTVTFRSMLEIKNVDFPVTIAEHQLGLYVVTEGPRWGSPAYSSSRFISLSAVQDPTIGPVRIFGNVVFGEEISVQVRIDNPGKVQTGSRRVSLMETEPALPRVFQGNIYEPVNFDPSSPGHEVNRTNVNVGPGSSHTVTMNYTVAPGRYRIWIEMETYPWEDDPRRSSGTTEIVCLPSYGIETNNDLHLVDDLEYFSAAAVIVNHGGCRMADLPVPEHGMQYGMVNPSMNLTLYSNFTSNSWTYMGSDPVDVMDLEPGGEMIIPLEYGGQRPVRGFIDHTASLDGFRIEAGRVRQAISRIIVQEKGGISLVSEPAVCVKTGIGNCLTLEVGSQDQRHYRAVFLTIYDGYIQDDVVKSQGIATGTGSAGIRSIDVPLNLEEGYYTITIVISVYPPDARSSDGSDSVTVYEGLYHIVVEEPAPQDGIEEEGYDWDRVQRAALIAIALAMMVIGAAVALKFTDKSGEGKS
ncbi:MAG: CARDB domain-containing protein [Thermoplasmatota archaeon]